MIFAFSCSLKKRFEPCCSANFQNIHAAVPEATPSNHNTLSGLRTVSQLWLVWSETQFHEFFTFRPNAVRRLLSRHCSKDSCCYGTRLCICPVRTASDIQRFPKLLCSSVIPSSWSVVFAFSCSQKIRFEPCCSVKFLKIHAAVLEIKLQTASLGSRKDCILFLCRSDWNSGCHCNIWEKKQQKSLKPQGPQL